MLELKELIKSKNIVELLDEDYVIALGDKVVKEYEIDKSSREDWEKKNEEAMKLALQVVEQKNFPWQGASNVKFPLITIAALQFHSRAYPALIPGKEIVKCRVTGVDEGGIKAERAKRIEKHMSFQLLEEDENWEDQMDKVLISTPIVGCAFKKTYWSPRTQCNVSEMVLAKDLVVNYWSRSLEEAQRITHVLYMTKNDIHERVGRGTFCEIDLGKPVVIEQGRIDEAKNKAQGTYPNSEDPATPYEILEQHRYLDLDEDGYAEPYIVTVHKKTKRVLRVVANYFEGNVEKNKHGKIIYIKPEQYFTKYSFIPSPDGGFYDLGFGSLLGPLNSSIDTLINQLIDAGTMANTAGGFLGRGLKIRGGNYSFAPLEWKHVETTGDDIRKNVFPLPVREPSQVLFTLLSLLINYGERIGSATEVMVGENPGQNTPAETSRNMVEQGQKIFNGIFKRIYRSLKQELRKEYRLNQLYLPHKTKFGEMTILLEDYMSPVEDISPVADPHIVSDSQRLQQAMALLDAAHKSPGYDLEEVNRRYLTALKVEGIEKVYPGPKQIPPPPNPKVQVEQIKQQGRMAEIQAKTKIAAMELMSKAELVQAQIMKLNAEAMKLMAEAKGVDTGHQIALLNTQIAAEKAHRDSLIRSAETLLKAMELDKEPEVNDATNTGGVSGVAAAPSH